MELPGILGDTPPPSPRGPSDYESSSLTPSTPIGPPARATSPASSSLPAVATSPAPPAAPAPSTLPAVAKPPAVARPPALATSPASSSLPAVTRRTSALGQAPGLLHTSRPAAAAASAASEKDTTDTKPSGKASRFADPRRAEIQEARNDDQEEQSEKGKDSTPDRPRR